MYAPFAKAKKFWCSMGYEVVHVVESVDHLGGIWVLTTRGSFFVSVAFVMNQVVSFIVYYGRSKWLYLMVYDSLIPSIRTQLWDCIQEVRQNYPMPWLLLGDFNEILLPFEVRGGSFSINCSLTFSQVLEDCGLLDFEAIGNKYIWFNSG